MSKKISKLHRVLVVLSMLLAPLFLTGFSPQRQTGEGGEILRITQVDTSEFPQVTVYVAVIDADGQPVGVNPSRLVIEENGAPIPLDQIQGVGEVGPLTTMLVMDVSGSMHVDGKLEAAKAAEPEVA